MSTYCCLNHFPYFTPAGFHNRLQIQQRLPCLLVYTASDKLAGLRVKTKAAGDKDEGVCNNGLAIRSDSSGCI